MAPPQRPSLLVCMRLPEAFKDRLEAINPKAWNRVIHSLLMPCVSPRRRSASESRHGDARFHE
jgi:hypothetical protein